MFLVFNEKETVKNVVNIEHIVLIVDESHDENSLSTIHLTSGATISVPFTTGFLYNYIEHLRKNNISAMDRELSSTELPNEQNEDSTSDTTTPQVKKRKK